MMIVGTLRSNHIHPAGDFTMHDLLTILPIVDPLLVVRITGGQLLEALENGVYRYPALDGRYIEYLSNPFLYENANCSEHLWKFSTLSR